MKKVFVISLGGSLFTDNQGLDLSFLKKFQEFIKKQIKQDNRFILITGGGTVCRQYQKVLKGLKKASSEDLDWMGLYVTRLNAELLRLALGQDAESYVNINPNKRMVFKKPVMVAGGWIPGRSTDDAAVRLAKLYGSDIVVNLSNIDYLYDKDPKKYPEAKPIKNMNWAEYIKMIGTKWEPGAHVPFDPVASQNAKKHKLKVIIANGKNFSNLKQVLANKIFTGTIIS